MAGWVLPLCLLLAATLQGSLPQAPGPAARAGPVLRRLRLLEEQFRRFQEVTLSHLQSIAKNYNISYNIDNRFQALAEQAEAADAARAVLGAELSRLAAAQRRLHRRLRRLQGTALSPWQRPLTHTEPRGLQDAACSHQEPRGLLPPGTPGPQPLRARQRLQEGERQLLMEMGTSRMPGEDAEPPGDARAVPAVLPTAATGPQEQLPDPLQPGTECSVGSVLLFPNASASDGALLQPGLRVGLRALSLCAWLLTPAPRLGTLLSYTSEDGASTLAVRGDRPGAAHFVIGDTAFRQLPVTPLLDNKWHHFCLMWSSERGQHCFYVDRRLLAAGSGFQQGYELPAGGSLVLGGQWDGGSRSSVPSGAFVGRLAGLALWSRALLPGEVGSMASGRGLPHGPLLTLGDAVLRGAVRREGSGHCP